MDRKGEAAKRLLYSYTYNIIKPFPQSSKITCIVNVFFFEFFLIYEKFGYQTKRKYLCFNVPYCQRHIISLNVPCWQRHVIYPHISLIVHFSYLSFFFFVVLFFEANINVCFYDTLGGVSPNDKFY
jgi:hypothetical protein